MKKIVFTGGGTLGHVMPNLFLAEELKSEYQCFYIGGNGIEKEKVNCEIPYYAISTTKLERGKFFKNFQIPVKLIKSISQAKKHLKEIAPDVVFSKGGYVALPVCVAAKMLHIPIISHESDYSFGLANKIILKLCKKMCVNFEHLEKKNKKIQYTGPIFSKKFYVTTKDFSFLNLDKTKPTMLVVCGSLGSQKINENLFANLEELLKTFNVIHITGKGNNKIKSYQNYNAFEMSNDIVNLYNIADFVVGRSGAGVTAECYFKHLPMILIPLENKASRGDQVLNAEYYENQGVAEILKEKDLTPINLFNKINNFYNNIDKFKNNYHKCKNKNGKEQVINIIKNIK